MIAIAFRKGPLAAFMFVIFPSIALAQEPNRPVSEKRPASNVAQAGRGYLTSLRKRVSDLRSNGRFDEAETILTRAAKEAEETCGPGDVVVIEVLGDFARNQWDQVNFDRAEQLERRIAALSRELFGQKDRRTADALGQLARMCTARGKYWEAEQLSDECLGIMKSLDLDMHYESFPHVVNLAELYIAMERGYEAEPLLEWANEILMIDSYQWNSYSMPRDLRWQKAVVLYMKGDEQAARSVLNKPLRFLRSQKEGAEFAEAVERERNREYFSPPLPERLRAQLQWKEAMRRNLVTARPASEKGDQYFRSGRYHEAAAAYRIAMDQYTMGLGPDDTLVAEAQANYSNALRRIGRNVEAEFWEQRVDEILRETITGAERNR